MDDGRLSLLGKKRQTDNRRRAGNAGRSGTTKDGTTAKLRLWGRSEASFSLVQYIVPTAGNTINPRRAIDVLAAGSLFRLLEIRGSECRESRS